MTGFAMENGRNFETATPKRGLANLPGILDHLRPVRLALLAVGVKGGPRQAKQNDDECR
jgi:hypothetical protein